MTTFIIRAKRGPRETCTAVDPPVRYAPKLRVQRERDTPVGRIRTMERVGDDRSQFEIRLPSDVALRSDGMRGFRYNHLRIKATKEDVKAKVRKMRPEEAEQIAAQDELIEAVKANLQVLREERDLMVREAFSRGHAVTIQELRDRAELR